LVANATDLERRLWEAADELRANSGLRSSEYSTPVLGLIFLRYADHKFTAAEADASVKSLTNPSQVLGKAIPRTDGGRLNRRPRYGTQAG